MKLYLLPIYIYYEGEFRERGRLLIVVGRKYLHYAQPSVMNAFMVFTRCEILKFMVGGLFVSLVGNLAFN